MSAKRGSQGMLTVYILVYAISLIVVLMTLAVLFWTGAIGTAFHPFTSATVPSAPSPLTPRV